MGVSTVVQKCFDSINQWPQNSIHLTPHFINPHAAFFVCNILCTLNIIFGYWSKIFENFWTKNLEPKCTEMAFFQKSSIFAPKIEPFWISNWNCLGSNFREFSKIFEKSEVKWRGFAPSVKQNEAYYTYRCHFRSIFGPFLEFEKWLTGWAVD